MRTCQQFELEIRSKPTYPSRMAFTHTIQVAMTYPQVVVSSTQPAWPHLNAMSPTNPATSLAVRGEASLDDTATYFSLIVTNHVECCKVAVAHSDRMPHNRSVLNNVCVQQFGRHKESHKERSVWCNRTTSLGQPAGVSPAWGDARVPGSWFPACGEIPASKRNDKALNRGGRANGRSVA